MFFVRYRNSDGVIIGRQTGSSAPPAPNDGTTIVEVTELDYTRVRSLPRFRGDRVVWDGASVSLQSPSDPRPTIRIEGRLMGGQWVTLPRSVEIDTSTDAQIRLAVLNQAGDVAEGFSDTRRTVLQTYLVSLTFTNGRSQPLNVPTDRPRVFTFDSNDRFIVDNPCEITVYATDLLG